MADNKAAGAPALDTNIESGGFDEKRAQHVPAAAAPPKPVDEEEDEDMDALIEDLESEDGHDVFDDDEEVAPGGGRVVPEDMLQTDSRVGLTEAEVIARRRKYGLNQMKEEKENLVLKFLGFFIGPIQFVMEVSFNISLSGPLFPNCFKQSLLSPNWPLVLATLETACFFRLSLVFRAACAFLAQDCSLHRSLACGAIGPCHWPHTSQRLLDASTKGHARCDQAPPSLRSSRCRSGTRKLGSRWSSRHIVI